MNVRSHFSLTLAALVVLQAACAEPEEFQGTFSEVPPVPNDRAYAYQLALFRFGEQVGGVARYYEIDGLFNTFDSPYNLETFCSYFGPFRVASGAIRFQVDGPRGESDTFHIASLGGAEMDAEVTRVWSESETEELAFSMVRESTQVDRQCDPPEALDLLVQLPALTTDDAEALSLAVAFVGYTLEQDPERRVENRVSHATFAVSRATADTWDVEQRVNFPDSPPQEGMSAANDPLQPDVRYALGYVVLFDDGDGDGDFNHFTAADEVLAVSLDQVVVFVDGRSADLAESVRGVFPDICGLPPPGYSLLNVETEQRGQDAHVISACQARGNVVALNAVEQGALESFPLLVPHGEDPEDE